MSSDSGTGGNTDSDERSQLRGSTLLLVGRVVSAAVGFGVQIGIVRHLSTSGYGVFAYGLALIGLAETAATLGLDRAISRFVPIFEERDESGKAAGTVAFVGTTVVALSLGAVAVIFVLSEPLVGSLGAGPGARNVLVVLAFLVPVQAVDNLLVGLFAVLARPTAIFFRRYVLAPGLRLAVVALLIALDRGTAFLAWGYVLAGVTGMVLYVVVLARALQRRSWSGRREVPVREILAFTLPLLSTDLVFVLIEATDALLLGHFRGPDAVAALRAVQPFARMNQLVLASFGILFTPLAARLFARNSHADIARLYWRTAAWVAVISFPIFAMTFVFATPVTTALFGGRYRDSAPLLALLALGYYANSAFGFNGLTLNVFGRVRAVLVVNVVAASANLVANLALIPRYGATGAALATMGTLMIQNLLRQLALARETSVPGFDRSYIWPYVLVVATVTVLVLVRTVTDPPLLAALGFGAGASLGLILTTRNHLRVGEVFPELTKIPGVRLLVSA